MNYLLRCACVATATCLISMPAFAADLKMSMHNGRVTIMATDVQVRQILAEWARLGQTTIVNGDKLAGAPVTLQIVDQPEAEALDIVLRSASGYIAAPRPAGNTGVSRFDRILIMPTSHPPAASAIPASVPVTYPRPNPIAPQPVDDDTDDGPPSANPQGPPNPPNPMMPYPGAPGEGSEQPGQPAPVLTSPRPGALPQPQRPGAGPTPYRVPPPMPLQSRPGVPARPGGGGEGGGGSLPS